MATVPGAKFALFIGETGIVRVVTTGLTLEDTEGAMHLYGTLRDDIKAFDEAVRRRVGAEERRRVDVLLDAASRTKADVN